MTLKSTLVVMAALAVSAAFAQDPNAGLTALQGKSVPAFKMTDIKGKSFTDKSLRGKVVVLDFWAMWCGPCKKASPVMQRLHEKYGKQGLVVIGAETMENGAPAGAKNYAKEHKYTYTFTSNNDAFTQALGIQAIPAFVIVGRDGKVKRVQTGVTANIDDLYNSFEKTIKPLLK